MLAKSRSRGWRRPRRLSEFNRPLHRAITSYLRMIEGRDEILGEHLGMVEHVLDRAHRRARHALAEAGMIPMYLLMSVRTLPHQEEPKVR